MASSPARAPCSHDPFSGPALCVCFIGYTGTNCLQCLPGYVEVSPGMCRPCTKDGSGRTIGVHGYGCNGKGFCNGSGMCVRLGISIPIVTLLSRVTAVCECFANHELTASGNCDSCAAGYYANSGTGNNCTACPGGAATPCTNKGTCASGFGSTGLCSCGNNTVNGLVVDYRGIDCDDPFINELTPSTAPARKSRGQCVVG